MTFEEKMQMREWMAKEKGFKLGSHYSEAQAAAFLGRNLSTLRRQREAGRIKPGIHYIDLGERGKRFGGWQIADMLLGGLNGPEDDGCSPNSPSGNTPSSSGEVAGKSAGTTDGASASQWALETFK